MSIDTLPNTLQIAALQIKEQGDDFVGDLSATVFDMTDDEQILCPNPLHYDLHVARVGESLLVKGSVESVLRVRCDRCLKYFDHEIVDSEICHYLEAPLPEMVDLTGDLREDILINLPQKFLCDEACKGLCPNCGQNLNVRPCECPQEAPATTTPWDKLDGLSI